MAVDRDLDNLTTIVTENSWKVGGVVVWWWQHCNYSYKLQVQVPQRFEIDLGPGTKLDNKHRGLSLDGKLDGWQNWLGLVGWQDLN